MPFLGHLQDGNTAATLRRIVAIKCLLDSAAAADERKARREGRDRKRWLWEALSKAAKAALCIADGLMAERASWRWCRQCGRSRMRRSVLRRLRLGWLCLRGCDPVRSSLFSFAESDGCSARARDAAQCQEQLRRAVEEGEADKVAELLQRDDWAAFIDRADGWVRNRALKALGNSCEARGARSQGLWQFGGLIEPGPRESDGAAGRAWDASVGDWSARLLVVWLLRF